MKDGHWFIPGLLRGAFWCVPCHTHCGGTPSVLCACCEALQGQKAPRRTAEQEETAFTDQERARKKAPGSADGQGEDS